jgi:hypothetical protein
MELHSISFPALGQTVKQLCKSKRPHSSQSNHANIAFSHVQSINMAILTVRLLTCLVAAEAVMGQTPVGQGFPCLGCIIKLATR